MKPIRILALLSVLFLAFEVTPLKTGKSELFAAAQDSEAVSSAQAALSNLQASMKFGQWSQLVPALSKRGKNAFVMEVFSVLAVSHEIADLNAEDLPAGLSELATQVATVSRKYQLDQIGKLIFDGDSPAAMKKIEAMQNKWEVVNALWKAQAGSPFHVHPAFGDVVAAEVDGDSVYLDIEMQPVSGAQLDAAAQLDMQGPAQVICMTKVGGQWKYAGLDDQRSMERMDKFVAETTPEANASPTELLDASFSGTTADGKEISLSDYKGKIVILDFWGTWCPPCVKSMPEMKLIHESFGKHGVEIIGVAADSKQNVAAFCNKTGIPWPNIIDPDEKLVGRFGVASFPTLMLIDQNGKLIHADIEKGPLVAELITRLSLEQKQFSGLLEALGSKATNER